MKIALDLDGVVTNIADRIVEFAKDGSVEVDPFHICNSLTTPEGVDHLEFIFNDHKFWNGLIPIEESWHCVNDWFSRNHDVIFITARRSELSIDEIHPWLERWNVMFYDVIVCDMGHKYEYINKINPAFYVDDNPNEIEVVIKNTKTPAYVMKSWYNDHAIGELPHIQSLSELGI